MLRSFVIRTLLITLSLSTASRAVADLKFYEGFDYPLGQGLKNSTHPNGNQWLQPSTPTGASTSGSSSPQTIIAGDIIYPHALATAASKSLSIPRALAPPSGTNTPARINIPDRPFTRSSGASIFFSFTMQMTSWTNFAPNGADTKNDAGAKNAANRLGGNIAGFHGGAASTSTGMSSVNGFGGTVLIRREIDYTQTGTDGSAGTQTGLYEIGMLKQYLSPGVTDLETAFDTGHSFGVGDVVLIVGEYDFVDTTTSPVGTADKARLWINPTPGDLSLASTPTLTAPATALNIAGTLSIESFYTQGHTNTPGGFSLDNIRVGTTFADVNVVAPPIAGDYDDSGFVDAADYVLWRKGGPLQNDPIGGPIGPDQYEQWRANFGKPFAASGSSLQTVSIPEPGTLLGLLVMAMVTCCARQNRR